MAQTEQVKTCKNGHPRTPENTYRAGKNGQWRRCKICRTECQARYNLRRRQHEPNLTLPSEPFCQWIEELVEEHGQVGTALLTGLAERQVQKFLYRQQEGTRPPTVHIDTVDRALQTYDGYEKLRDLYPSLYEDT